jgi:hypothetical protein
VFRLPIEKEFLIMRTLQKLFSFAAVAMLIALALPDRARADTCNCAATGVCVCAPGQCQCPGCPSNPSASSAFPVVIPRSAPLHYPVAAVYAVPVYRAVAAPVYATQVYQPPAYRQPSSCYFDGRQWVCPNAASAAPQAETWLMRPPGMTGGDWRRMKRAARDGRLIFE